MYPAHTKIAKELFTLKQTAEILKVTVETLLEWNDNNILKPTITLNGDVGYTQEQINKFLSIQQASQESKIESFSSHSSLKPDFDQQIEQINIKTGTEVIKSSKIKRKILLSFGIISSFSVISISLIAIFFSQQNRLNFLPNLNIPASQKETGNIEKNTILQMNEARYLGSTTPSLQILLRNKNVLDNDLKHTGTDSSDNILAAPYSIFTKESATTEANILNNIPVLASFGQISENNSQLESGMDIMSIKYSIFPNFASKSNCPNCFKNVDTAVFDNDGNIKGEATTKNLLASTLETRGIVQGDNSYKLAPDLGFLLAFLTLGLLSVIFIFKTQSVYSVLKSNEDLAVRTNTVSGPQIQKVIEIDQKTDGTVVLFFQGEEYKVSKPELNSETDQFIERLLGLVPEDIKEISYDIFKDKRMKLNAPLSKLVTRLGFVGLKRDLFFPRTSKNKVLFRKFITREDLVSLGLTTNQISNDLIN